MFLSLFHIIQSQRKISWLVVAIAGVVFLITVALIVYFFRRLRKNEQEAEDDWSLSSRSLFKEAVPTDSNRAQPGTESQAEPEAALPPREIVAAEDTAPVYKGETLMLASEPPVAESLAEDEARSGYTRMPETESPAPPVTGPQPGMPETELLTSPEGRDIEPPVSSGRKPADQGDVVTLFDDEFWAGLETDEQRPSPAPPAETERPAYFRKATPESALGSQQQVSNEPVEPPAERVEQRARLEPFEAPTIKALNQREPFEPPRIEPIVPRNQTALSALADPAQRDVKADVAPPVRAREADLDRLTSQPIRQTVAGTGSEASDVMESAATASRQTRLRERAVSGSVLGLPAGASDAPMIYGERAHRDEATIDSLTNYRKESDRSGGSWATIVLIITVVLIGGLAIAYWYSNAFRTSVNDLAARVRGSNPAQTAPPPGSQQAKAQVTPVRRLEVVKNMVKARGAVDNISDETLDNLSLEVTLERNDQGQAETRMIPINPSQLAPRQRGVYEFEYDGNQATGYKGYFPSRLISNGAEVKIIKR